MSDDADVRAVAHALLSKGVSNAPGNDEGPGFGLLFGALTRAFGEWAILGSNQ
jgi:hypothetical protein